METLSIRKAEPADVASILSLLGELDLEGDHALGLAEATEKLATIHACPNYTVFIAEIAGEAVGTFALLVMDKMEHGGAPAGIVDSVAVRQEVQGKGIGKKMMHFAMDRCREAGCYKLMLSSNMKREQAHAFYDSLGFERHGYSFSVHF
jgi:GNAT superfamily N-acetyltransferase